MYKIIFIGILIGAVTTFATAQNTDQEIFDISFVKASEDAKTKAGITQFVGNNLLVAWTQTKTMQIKISSYNKGNLNLQGHQEYTLGKGSNPMTFVSLGDNSTYFFYNKYDNKEETTSLYYIEIDANTGKIKGEKGPLLSSKTIIPNAYEKIVLKNNLKNQTHNPYTLEKSEDGTKLAVNFVRSVKSDKKEEIFKDQYFLFDQNLNLIFEKSLDMQLSWKDNVFVEKLKMYVDDTGNIYSVNKSFSSKPTKDTPKGKPTSTTITINKISKNISPVKKLTQVFNYQDIKTIDFYVLNGKTTALGLYSEWPRNMNLETSKRLFSNPNSNKMVSIPKRAKGVYKLNFDSNELEVDFIHAFDPTLYFQYNVDRNFFAKQQKKGTLEFRGIDLDHVLVKEDGSLLLTFENNYQHSSNLIYYVTKNIILLDLDKKHNIKRTAIIPKHQKSLPYGGSKHNGSSYSYLVGKNSICFIYIDHPDNLTLKETDTPSIQVVGKGGYLTVSFYNLTSGKIEKRQLFNTLNYKGENYKNIQPSRLLQYDENSFLLPQHLKNKMNVWAILKIKESPLFSSK